MAEWIWSGTDKGLFKTGKNFSVRGVSVYEVSKGKISRYKEFYDLTTIMRQVGLLPTEKE
jgi:ketosteroid isomerase-like protein